MRDQWFSELISRRKKMVRRVVLDPDENYLSADANAAVETIALLKLLSGLRGGR